MNTPNDIEVLLHYYVSPEPHPRVEADAVRQTIGRYLKEGILEEDKEGTFVEGTKKLNCYCVTDKGKAWLRLILSVPYPKQAWVGQDGKIILPKEGLLKRTNYTTY